MDKRLFAGIAVVFLLLVGWILNDFGIVSVPFFSSNQSSKKSLGVVFKKVKTVQRRSQSSLSWDDVDEQEKLFSYDSVLTLEQSEAQLKMNDGVDVNLDANSLITILPPENKQDAIAVNLKSGSYSVSIKKGKQIRVGGVMVKSSQDSSLQFKAGADSKTHFTVLTGSVAVQEAKAPAGGNRLPATEARPGQGFTIDNNQGQTKIESAPFTPPPQDVPQVQPPGQPPGQPEVAAAVAPPVAEPAPVPAPAALPQVAPTQPAPEEHVQKPVHHRRKRLEDIPAPLVAQNEPPPPAFPSEPPPPPPPPTQNNAEAPDQNAAIAPMNSDQQAPPPPPPPQENGQKPGEDVVVGFEEPEHKFIIMPLDMMAAGEGAAVTTPEKEQAEKAPPQQKEEPKATQEVAKEDTAPDDLSTWKWPNKHYTVWLGMSSDILSYSQSNAAVSSLGYQTTGLPSRVSLEGHPTPVWGFNVYYENTPGSAPTSSTINSFSYSWTALGAEAQRTLNRHWHGGGLGTELLLNAGLERVTLPFMATGSGGTLGVIGTNVNLVAAGVQYNMATTHDMTWQFAGQLKYPFSSSSSTSDAYSFSGYGFSGKAGLVYKFSPRFSGDVDLRGDYFTGNYNFTSQSTGTASNGNESLSYFTFELKVGYSF